MFVSVKACKNPKEESSNTRSLSSLLSQSPPRPPPRLQFEGPHFADHPHHYHHYTQHTTHRQGQACDDDVGGWEVFLLAKSTAAHCNHVRMRRRQQQHRSFVIGVLLLTMMLASATVRTPSLGKQANCAVRRLG